MHFIQFFNMGAVFISTSGPLKLCSDEHVDCRWNLSWNVLSPISGISYLSDITWILHGEGVVSKSRPRPLECQKAETRPFAIQKHGDMGAGGRQIGRQTAASPRLLQCDTWTFIFEVDPLWACHRLNLLFHTFNGFYEKNDHMAIHSNGWSTTQ